MSSTEIGIKVTDDFSFNGENQLTLSDNISATSIKFSSDLLQNAPGGWYYAGDLPNTGPTQGLTPRVDGALPQVFDGIPLYLFNEGINPYMTTIDLSNYVGSRRAIVRMVVTGQGTGSAPCNVWARTYGAYPDDGQSDTFKITELIPYPDYNYAGWGDAGVTVGGRRISSLLDDPKAQGGTITVMTDDQGRIEISAWNARRIQVWLESFCLYNTL